ncbi:hypothetical protein RSPO_m00796 (plasmid) [Ralstonia solanacearum Po82]|uniref:Uncharacterized protein n=1 Tax=Ralstonia solanacearum (strain Po82) TaxID=1031711 RepID=F6G8Z4_RALS8|nr:hypothetical protein RSPO_m00796 [Ralstonia solanacearum Po82]
MAFCSFWVDAKQGHSVVPNLVGLTIFGSPSRELGMFLIHAIDNIKRI